MVSFAWARDPGAEELTARQTSKGRRPRSKSDGSVLCAGAAGTARAELDLGRVRVVGCSRLKREPLILTCYVPKKQSSIPSN